MRRVGQEAWLEEWHSASVYSSTACGEVILFWEHPLEAGGAGVQMIDALKGVDEVVEDSWTVSPP